MNDMYDEEQKYLEFVEKCIQLDIQKATEDLQKLRELKISFDDAKRGEHFNKEAMMEIYSSRIKRLKRIISSPFFGRFDFQPSDASKATKLYVGKTYIDGESGQTAVIDWRSPIASMYYDSSVGSANYVAPKGIIEGYLSLKRQIIIEDAIIQKIIDTDLITSDEILQEYLNVHADNRMKTIISSIQKEQNDIIRRPLKENIIVQGVAGSGKTSVALHRVAYLLYSLNKDNSKAESSQFLIIGPNDYFLDYISGVLPDLEVENASQTTLADMIKERVDSKIKIMDYSTELKEYYSSRKPGEDSRIKDSNEFVEAMHKFIQDLLCYYKTHDIEYEGKVLFPKEDIEHILNSLRGGFKNNINEVQQRIIKKIKQNYSDYVRIITKDKKSAALALPKKDPTRNKLLDEILAIEKEAKTGFAKVIKEHFQVANKKIMSLYLLFIDNIDRYLSFEDIEGFKKRNYKTLSKNKISRDDIAPLLYMLSMLENVDDNKNIKHVIVDEAQDFGVLEFAVLKKLFPNASFSVFGDLNQSIYSYRSVKDWESVNERVFENQANIIQLNQSYRTTDEIMKEANKVSKHLTGTAAEEIIRHGNAVDYNYYNSQTKIDSIANKVQEYEASGYKSIAIISKTESEAKTLCDELKKKGITVKNITADDVQYFGGVCTITSNLVKGLEFDAAILIDVDAKNYNPEHEIDMKLLYVAMTRALHEMTLFTSSDFTPVLKDNYSRVLKK